MEQLHGVTSVESGYMGGHVQAPTYEDVSSQTSGHFETVRVRFDPERISYEEVARLFFEIHDPTQADGQGPDIGPEYRSVVFFSSPEQQATAKELIGQLRVRGYDVVTELRPVERFWEAEQYHQDYYERTGKRPYCHFRVRRFGD
jgi:peptide methionine sulfoxide reductase msrA/msrB